MLLNVRSIAISVAVTAFFGLSLISWFSGLAPFTCCKRALVGAAGAYMAASLTIRAINAILTNAIITSQVSQREQDNGEHQE